MTCLNKPKLFFLPTVKWFQVFICITNNLTKQPFICMHIALIVEQFYMTLR